MFAVERRPSNTARGFDLSPREPQSLSLETTNSLCSRVPPSFKPSFYRSSDHPYPSPFIRSSISLLFHPSISLLLHPSISLLFHPSISLLFHPSIRPCIPPSSLSTHPPMRASIRPTLNPSIHPSACLFSPSNALAVHHRVQFDKDTGKKSRGIGFHGNNTAGVFSSAAVLVVSGAWLRLSGSGCSLMSNYKAELTHTPQQRSH